MAKTLSIITNGKKGGLPVQNAGLKLSKIIGIDKIELHDGFKNLYTIKPDRLERIEASMREHGFEQNRPIDIWITTDENGTEHFYLIDGHTRVTAAKAVGMTTIPYFEHHFGTYNEALLYAIHTQIDRRNIDGIDFLNNIKFLMESDYIKDFKGSRNAEIARILGVSEKTVERGKYVIEHASEEQWEEIRNENATVNSIHTKLKEADFFEKNASDEQKEAVESGEAEIKEINAEIKASQKEDKENDSQMSVEDDDSESETIDSDEADSEIDDFDDISDALEDTSDNPKGLTISDHSDHIERPTNKLSAEEDSERTRERRKVYETGYFEGFLQAANYVLSAVVADHALSSLYINIFCNPAYHNYEQFTHMGASCYLDAEYKYSKFRKELLAERNLEDLNPSPIKEYSSQNGDLPLDFAKEESETEESESSGSVTDLSTFGIDFAEGE